MFLKYFEFQILLLALAFALTSAQQKAPATSPQVCTNGLHPTKEDTKITCDTRQKKTYSCIFNTCYILLENKKKDLTNYVLKNCKSIIPGKGKVAFLHPTDFKLSDDGKSYIVKAGWFFKDKNKKDQESITSEHTCDLGPDAQTVYAQCGECSPTQ
ncbi:hypothetical protein O181_016043 [Austropuccinia psidii MF-1]|uniref:Secreted protein n=1 Tax=Austropuccinia psidii MF-1 TaxID=1389203 RepID=A0A9Q3C3L1_9BASI|nr:hypothetical protein [Austropuccinia psidii MF-1]